MHKALDRAIAKLQSGYRTGGREMAHLKSNMAMMAAALAALSFAGPMEPAQANKSNSPAASAKGPKTSAPKKSVKPSKRKAKRPSRRAKARAAQIEAGKQLLHAQYRGVVAKRSRDALKAQVAQGKPARSVAKKSRPGVFARIGAFFSGLFGSKAKAEARRGTIVSVQLDRLVRNPINNRAEQRNDT